MLNHPKNKALDGLQLLAIANMESFNAILIEQKSPQSERFVQLNNMAKSQL